MKKKFFRGQSTAEYAVLLAVLAGALISMQIYLKRWVQGRIKDLADQVSPAHYEQTRTDSVYTTVQRGTTVQRYNNGISTTYLDPNVDLDKDGKVDAPEAKPEEIKRSGYEQSAPEEQ